ncbi:MAG TPA: YvcK family protein, partial [Anaerolineae bacterium]|nr:YvcK family protein [Anaerolineae bacterium]
LDFYRRGHFPLLFYYLTLQFLARPYRALLLGLLGIGLIIVALWGLSRSVIGPLLRPGQEDLAEVVYRHRQRGRGPKVVAIGGGTGLSTLLRGLKEHTSNITAIVTVADDGGSSGRLRRELGLPPPGDFRNCIAALSEAERLTTRLFQYRFGNGSGLNGHSFGNLFIAAMAGVTGSFDRALLESSRVLAVRGRVLPSTLENVTLCAEVQVIKNGEVSECVRVRGESQIPKAEGCVERVFLEPENAKAYPEVIRAILEADLIVAGPGSLFTSVLPNLLVPDVVRAIRASRALCVYVCNVATQRGETDGFDVAAHVAALQRHVGRDLFPLVLANNNTDVPVPEGAWVEWVRPPAVLDGSYTLITEDLVDRIQPWRHDSQRLAAALMSLL